MWVHTGLRATQQLKYISRPDVRFRLVCQQLCAPELASSSLEWPPKHHCSLPNTLTVSIQAIIGVNKRLAWLRFTVVYRSDLEVHGDPSDLRG